MRRLITIAAICLSCQGLRAQAGEGWLFADSIKARMPMAVGDFLERYLEFAVLSTRDYDARQRMADDKVTVREGSLGNIPKLSTARDFSLNCFDDRGYEACWTDSLGTVLLRLQFPISLELLMGKPKAEVEKEFKYLLLAEADTVAPIALPDSVCPFDGCCYRSADVTHYFVESLNTATYYTRDGDRWKPVFDDSLKCLSAENLLKGAVDSCAEYRLYIEQNLYGYQQKTYIVKLSQWLNFCRRRSLDVYAGIEEVRQDGLKALLVAHDNSLGCNHMMSVILPDDFIRRHNSVLKATLNAYIPTNNVKNLYQQQKEEKR